MQSEHNIRLTAAEIGSLWAQYMNVSLAICTIRYFIEKTEDTQIMPVLQSALKLAQSQVQQIATFFRQDGFPVPIGFTDGDVTLTAPRLFSDPFHLYYIKNMAKPGMLAYSLSLSLASRTDIRSFLLSCIKTSADLDEMATQVMLSKGVYVRPPYIIASENPEYIQGIDFLGRVWGGSPRRLSSMEITHLFLNAQSNVIGKALITGFSQVAKSIEIRQFFQRGAEIADKHIELFSATLKESGIPGPMKLDTDITASTLSPFSDKLMLFHILTLQSMSFGSYAAAITASLRLDISVDYIRLAAELEKFGYDGLKLFISKGWAEEPPMTIDRKELALSPS